MLIMGDVNTCVSVPTTSTRTNIPFSPIQNIIPFFLFSQACVSENTPSKESLPPSVAFEVCMSPEGTTAPRAPPPRRLTVRGLCCVVSIYVV